MREHAGHIVMTMLDGVPHPVRVFVGPSAFQEAQGFITTVAPHRNPNDNIAYFPTTHVALRTDCDRPIGSMLWIEDITVIEGSDDLTPNSPNRDGEQPPPADGE